MGVVNDEKAVSLLSGFRALDLSDEKGFLCGRLLADLGVDVIKIENPCGDSARNLGPFYHDTADPEKSLYWFAFNANKRGITLDIKTKDGQEIFKKLVKNADFVVECFQPGYMDSLGLGYSTLSNINRRLIMVSITSFGQSGPYKDYKGSDIVGMAMGGLMSLTGDPDRAPLRISFPQACLHAGAEATTGALIAHYVREATGEGQHVDVSVQATMTHTLINARLFWDLNGVNLGRTGACRAGLYGAGALQVIWPCRDGYVVFVIHGGPFGATTNRALVEWMESEGIAPDGFTNIDWDSFELADDVRMAGPFAEVVGDFFRRHTKAELYEEAVKRHIMLCPVATTMDIVQDPQLEARDFWEELDHPELGTKITYPGSFVRLANGRGHLQRRAPLIGEHNEEIYTKELGFYKEELVVLKEGKVI